MPLVGRFSMELGMAVTLTFVALCVAAVLFMLRFLVAIWGKTGNPACIGYAVQVRPASDTFEGGAVNSRRHLEIVYARPDVYRRHDRVLRDVHRLRSFL